MNNSKRGEIFTLIATVVVILIGVTTFITTTFLNKSNKKLTYQSKAACRVDELCVASGNPPSQCEICDSSTTPPPPPPPAVGPDERPTEPPVQDTTAPPPPPPPQVTQPPAPCTTFCDESDSRCFDYNKCYRTQPQPTQSSSSNTCECVKGYYQGPGCVGGQINEPCSSAVNLDCFGECLSQGGGVEACNKECNKLENQGFLNTPTPGVGGNVCGKIGESPNDLYGCCPGLVEDPSAGYCRPSVAVGKPTPTPKPFWMLPNITPIPSPTSAVGILPPGARCSGNAACSSGLCSPTPYGYYCASESTPADCGGTETICNGSVIMKCVNGGYVRSGSCAGGCDDSGGSAACTYVPEAQITPPPKGCMGGQAVMRGTTCFGCFGATGDWGPMPEEYCKSGATITDADVINNTTDPTKRSEFRQAGWDQFANDQKNSESDRIVAKIAQGADMFSNWWGGTTTNLSSNIAKAPVLGGATQLLLGWDPNGSYTTSKFDTYLTSNLAANAANPDRQRCGNLESVIDMLSGPIGMANAEKRGCANQIKDAVVIGALGGAENAVNMIPVVGNFIYPITNEASEGIIDIVYGNNKAEAGAAKSTVKLGKEIIAPAKTVYDIAAFRKVAEELAGAVTQGISKSAVDKAFDAGMVALKKGDTEKAEMMQKVMDAASKIYNLSLPEVKVVPYEATGIAAKVIKDGLSAARDKILSPGARANIGQSTFGKAWGKFQDTLPKTAEWIRERLFHQGVGNVKQQVGAGSQ